MNPESNMSIASLKKRARAETLEVEHLLKEATFPNVALANTLDELSAELQWSASGTLDDGTFLHDKDMGAPADTLECFFSFWQRGGLGQAELEAAVENKYGIRWA